VFKCSKSDSNGNLEHRKRCRAPIAISFLDTSGTSLINTAARSNRSSRSTASLSSSRVKTKKGELLTSGIIGTRDRRRYLHWVFAAKKRFGLCVLDYEITSNHVHLLVEDTRPNVIAQSMQLIAGRTAQEYNQRRAMQGAFWEDRYPAIEIDEHLVRCLGSRAEGQTSMTRLS
jgi:REP element-mobilizing transposase RayT